MARATCPRAAVTRRANRTRIQYARLQYVRPSRSDPILFSRSSRPAALHCADSNETPIEVGGSFCNAPGQPGRCVGVASSVGGGAWRGVGDRRSGKRTDRAACFKRAGGLPPSSKWADLRASVSGEATSDIATVPTAVWTARAANDLPLEWAQPQKRPAASEHRNSQWPRHTPRSKPSWIRSGPQDRSATSARSRGPRCFGIRTGQLPGQADRSCL